jgi:hypothetical protein
VRRPISTATLRLRARTYPCPIFTRLRYSRVGSASVQIACRRLTMSASFALSFFSRRRGVAPAPTLASCVAAGLGGAAGVRSRLAAGAGADGALALSAPFGADGRPG